MQSGDPSVQSLEERNTSLSSLTFAIDQSITEAALGGKDFLFHKVSAPYQESKVTS